MPHSYIANRLHLVFSTHERRKLLTTEIRPRLWAYLAGVGRNHELTMHEVGGHDEHAHILMSLPATILLAAAVQNLKAVSSKWLRESGMKDFRWQQGYAAFSVSQSNIEAVRRYIRNQEQHHRKISFEDEFRTLLRRHGIEFDERYVFG